MGFTRSGGGGVTLPITESDVTSLVSDLAAKAPLASPVFTGTVKYNSHYGDITTDVDGTTVTFNMATTDKHQVVLGGNRTLAVSNDQVGQLFMITLQQDATGSRTVTWWSGILWPGGTVPTLTTTGNKRDVFSFLKLATGSYLGFTVGLNL